MTLDDDLGLDDLDRMVPTPDPLSVTPLHVRLQPALTKAVDDWIGRHGPPYVSRPEALRRLAVQGLKAGDGK